MRYPAVAWLEDSDFRAMGPAESSVELPGDLTVGLRIVAPFGKDTDAMLAIRAIQTETPGGVITLAITSVIERRVAFLDLDAMQSNPRRAEDDGA